MKKMKNNLMLLLTAVIWGFAFTAQRVGGSYVGPFIFNGIRFLLGAVSLIPVILFFEPREKERAVHNPKMKLSVIAAIAAGSALLCATVLQQYGINITQSAGKAGFITGLYTVLVPIFGIFMRKKTNVNVWIGVAFAVAGLFLLSVTDGWRVSAGDAVLMLCAVMFTFHILIVDRFVAAVYPLRFACMQFAVGGVLGIIAALLFETATPEGLRGALIPILYGGICSTGIAYTCQIIGQKNADPTEASIILSTESLFSAVGGALIMHEVMTPRGYIGCALMFAGIIISQLRPKKRDVSG